MKHIFILSLLILILNSCKKMMHEEQLSIGKIDSKEELITATDAIYGMLNKLTQPSGQTILGDDISYGNDSYDYYDIYSTFKHCWTDLYIYRENQSEIIESNWLDEYQIVACENNIIRQFENNSKYKEIFGEAFFLRAYSYILLTQRFGKVPIIDDVNVSYTVRRSSVEEINKFIESDLRKAMELLPRNNMSARIPYVTPNKGTAKAFLAELYLSWAGYPAKDKQKYTDAAKEAGELIDSASYFGYEILPDFADLWKRNHLYNSENIFSFYCDYYLSEYKLWFSMLHFYNFYDSWPTEVNFFNNYPPGYRKEITFTTTKTFYKYFVDTITWQFFITDSLTIHLDKIDHCARVAYRKFWYDTTTVVNGNQSNSYGINRNYIYRFAQVLLTYAEAMARSGQLNEKAYKYTNIIRRRARHLPLNEPSIYDLPKGLSPEAFADSVVWERAWELCAENNVRWNDLRRLELVEKLPQMRDEFEGGPPLRFDKSVYYEQVPKSELRLNPNLQY